jgi:hypothetical protein
MTEFNLENRKMAELSRGKRASVGSVSACRLDWACGSVEAHAVSWSMWGHQDKAVGACTLAQSGMRGR